MYKRLKKENSPWTKRYLNGTRNIQGRNKSIRAKQKSLALMLVAH